MAGSLRIRPLAAVPDAQAMRRDGNFILVIWIRSECQPTRIPARILCRLKNSCARIRPTISTENVNMRIAPSEARNTKLSMKYWGFVRFRGREKENESIHQRRYRGNRGSGLFAEAGNENPQLYTRGMIQMSREVGAVCRGALSAGAEFRWR